MGFFFCILFNDVVCMMDCEKEWLWEILDIFVEGSLYEEEVFFDVVFWILGCEFELLEMLDIFEESLFK